MGDFRRVVFCCLLMVVRCKMSGCIMGEMVWAVFQGIADLGRGGYEQCHAAHDGCWFPARVASFDGDFYIVQWDDGDQSHRRVPAGLVRRRFTEELCSVPVVYDYNDPEDPWQPSEIPCTILLRLHWNASKVKWRKRAISKLRKEHLPDEVIGGFEWHVIFRFHVVNQCERVFKTIHKVLKTCADPEECYAHEYVKGIEYVGDDPNTRKVSGRHLHEQRDEL